MITGSIVALVTPMTDSADVDWRRLEQLIDFHIESGTAALGLVGTTGEASTLSHPEHREVIRFGVSHAGGRIPIMAGRLRLISDSLLQPADARGDVPALYGGGRRHQSSYHPLQRALTYGLRPF